MKMRSYLIGLCLVLGVSLVSTACGRQMGCPAQGTSATRKERKKGGTSNLFDKKTRKRIYQH